MAALQTFLVAAAGASAQELLWWYNARFKLSEDEYRTLVTSYGYWAIIAAFVLGTGFLACIWYSGATPSPRDVLLTGAAMPLLIKQGLKPVSPGQHLGETSSRFDIWLYLK